MSALQKWAFIHQKKIYLTAITACSAVLMYPRITLLHLILRRSDHVKNDVCVCEAELCFKSRKVRRTQMLHSGYCGAGDNLPVGFQFMTLFWSLFHLPQRRLHSQADT